MEGGQQQHANEHSDGCEQRKIYCSHHPIMKNIGSHDRSYNAARAFHWSVADFGASNA
jgi:hypothetical protein